MVRYALIALSLAVAPVGLAACGSDDKVTRQEAAPCVAAIDGWFASGVGDAPAVARASERVRANCDDRVFPVALAAAGVSDDMSIADFCGGDADPYRESRLCADLPQPGQ
jgi:hypothetical protein